MLHFDDQNRIVEIEILSASTKFVTGALDGLPLPGQPERSPCEYRDSKRLNTHAE